MSFMIKSDVSQQYLLEEDAVEGFRQAVNNGQVRLALQILVDIVDVFEGFIASVVEDDDDEENSEDPQEISATETKLLVTEQVKQAEEVNVQTTEIVEEKKASPKKAATKTEEAIKVTAE